MAKEEAAVTDAEPPPRRRILFPIEKIWATYYVTKRIRRRRRPVYYGPQVSVWNSPGYTGQ